MTTEIDSVDVPGPPLVRAMMRSNTISMLFSVITMLMVKKAASSGNVIDRNCSQPDAPSSEAASYSCGSIVCNPAR